MVLFAVKAKGIHECEARKKEEAVTKKKIVRRCTTDLWQLGCRVRVSSAIV